MINRIEKINWGKFRIRGRKDWGIFWVFAVLVCYAVGSHYGNRFGWWLFRFANPYMTALNQPYTWGQFIPFFFLLATVAEAVLFFCKKSVRAKILVLAGVLLMPSAVLAGYRLHTNLIVSSLWGQEPARVSVSLGSGYSGGPGGRTNITLTDEERRELLGLCRNLKIVADETEQEALRMWYTENDTRPFAEASSIQIYFGEKYGHNYCFWLRVYDGQVFLWRGYSSSRTEITFFEDNGIVGLLDKIADSAEPLAAQGSD